MRELGRHRYTWQDYLAVERDANVKHEFFDGEIYAMAGGTPEHAALCAAVIGSLVGQLVGKPCRAFTSDLRVRVAATGLATYPDVTVICGALERDAEAADVVVNPTVLVEVLSSSTQDYDRGAKFENYRKIPSLKEYVLVSHRERLIEVFRRGAAAEWDRVEARSTALARLESIECSLDVDAIYAGIDLDRRGG